MAPDSQVEECEGGPTKVDEDVAKVRRVSEVNPWAGVKYCGNDFSPIWV